METSISNHILLVFALLSGAVFVITIMLVKGKTHKKSQHLEKCTSSKTGWNSNSTQLKLDGTDSSSQVEAKLIPDMMYFTIR